MIKVTLSLAWHFLGQLLKNVKVRYVSETRQDRKSTLRDGRKSKMIKLEKQFPQKLKK